MTETCGCACAQDTGVSRRKMMLRLGAGMTAAGAALMGVPILGFVLSAVTRPTHAQEGVSIGPIEQFPAEQTRLVGYQNPATRAWGGGTGHVACRVRRVEAP